MSISVRLDYLLAKQAGSQPTINPSDSAILFDRTQLILLARQLLSEK
jgi:hypothetical protein